MLSVKGCTTRISMKMNSAISGLLAGAFATACMSAVMMSAKKLGVQGEHPPKRITQGLAKSLGKLSLRGKNLSLMAGAAHLGFGMTAGLLFAAAQRQFAWKRPILYGVAYGLGIWFVSYKGWVPKAGLMPSAENDRCGRVATMVASHVVFGATLASGINELENASNLKKRKAA